MEETFHSLCPGAHQEQVKAACIPNAGEPATLGLWNALWAHISRAPCFSKQDSLFSLCSPASSCHPGAHSSSLLHITSRHSTMCLCLVVSPLLPGFLSAIQFYKLLGWDSCLSSSFETVIHSVHPLNRALSARETQKLVSKTNRRTGGLPGFSRSMLERSNIIKRAHSRSLFFKLAKMFLDAHQMVMSFHTSRVLETNPVS